MPLKLFHLPCVDPEAYSWDPFDSDLLSRLNLRNYVSMSRERRLNIPPASITSFIDRQIAPGAGNNSSESALSLQDYTDAQDPDRHIGASSIFEAKTPGAIALRDVEKELELGEWKLKINRIGKIVHLEVRGSLPIAFMTIFLTSPIGSRKLG